jgi:hypothetical protein
MSCIEGGEFWGEHGYIVGKVSGVCAWEEQRSMSLVYILDLIVDRIQPVCCYNNQ